jgi:glucose/arabinose dehydrogenase
MRCVPVTLSSSALIFLLIVNIPLVNVYSLSSKNTKTQFFGCGIHGSIFHCDPFLYKQESYETTASESNIATVTRDDPSYVTSVNKQNKALQIQDAYREFVEIANNKIYSSPNFSVSFWIRTHDSDRYGEVLSHISKNTTSGWSFRINGPLDNQSLQFVISGRSGNATVSTGIPISNLTYTHVVGTFDGSNIQMYRNGVLFGASQFKGGQYIADPSLPIHIGSGSYCDSCQRWNGEIADVRIYNKTITNEEARRLSSSNSSDAATDATVQEGLVGHWTFNGTLRDTSGYHNHGIMPTILSSMVFSPDGRLFFTKKNSGEIGVMKDDVILLKPFVKLHDVYVNWEQGMLGLAIDPHYEKNNFVYLYYTALKGGTPFNRVVRFTDNNNTATNMTILLDDIPASKGYHSGGGLAFGPDDKLYITVGDATMHTYAQSIATPIGKTLRINRDGTIPDDNPFPGSPVYTYGHRNMFGIAFNNKDGIGILTENGDELYDQINLISKGGNYGFPTYRPTNVAPELSNSSVVIKPLRSYWATIAPTQAIYYTGNDIPYLKNKFLFGTYTGNIYAIGIGKDNKHIVTEDHITLRHYPFEPVDGIAQSPNGSIYYGGYNIYKLSTLNMHSKDQDLFSLEVSHSPTIIIDDLQMRRNDRMFLNLRTDQSLNKNNDGSFVYPTMKIKIPTSLLNNLSAVTFTDIEGNSSSKHQRTPINFTSSVVDKIFNVINISEFKLNVPKSQVLILAAKNNSLSGTTTNQVTNTGNSTYNLTR